MVHSPRYVLLPLTPETAGFGELLAESERGRFRMLERLRAEWVNGTDRFERRGEILVGAFADERLIGAGGRNVDPFAGDPRTGRVRHLYVAQDFRKKGVGRLLMDCILTDAGMYFRRLNVRAPVGAFGFYEHLGFERVEGSDTVSHRLIL
jgi:GNAT superfamily N-acetyltransferase